MISSLVRQLCCILLVLLPSANAFALSPTAFVADSAGVDTSRKPTILPIPFVGSIDKDLPSSSVVTDSERNYIDYRYLPDLLVLSAGAFTHEFGAPGEFPDVTLRGVGGASLSFLGDGIRLNDPLFGLFNPTFIPLEQVERIEVVSGTQAYLHGLNSTGGAFNLLSKSLKALRAQSRLRYSESAFGYSLVDGSVSRDIVRGLNVSAGAQHTTFGPRFTNGGQDAWNGRVKLRYNVSKVINLMVAETYNQDQLALNGGIDISATPDSLRFDRLQATVRNTDAYEKTTRNDLQLGAAMRLLCDTTAVSTLTLWHSSQVREFRDGENAPFPPRLPVRQDQRSQWYGLSGRHHQAFGPNVLDAAVELQTQRVLVTPATDERLATLLGLDGSILLRPVSGVGFQPSVRIDRYLHEFRIGYGFRGTASVGGGAELFGGYSRSFRFPTFEERFGLDTLLSSGLTDESIERHHLFEGGIRWDPDSSLSASIGAFHRTVFGPISALRDSGSASPFRFAQGAKMILQGFDGRLMARAGKFFIEGRAVYLEQQTDGGGETTVPRWTVSGGVYYWAKLFEDHLNLKAGIRGNYFSAFTGQEFNQQALVYLGGGQSFPIPAAGTLDLVLLARLGDAHLHFVVDNVLDREYVTAAYYPMTQRAFRFGLSWEFLN
jgi:outer membrane receptor protein involved in Fe transport